MKLMNSLILILIGSFYTICFYSSESSSMKSINQSIFIIKMFERLDNYTPHLDNFVSNNNVIEKIDPSDTPYIEDN